MNIYQDLEDCLYNIVEALHPDWKILFAFTNAAEPVNPYLVIDVKKLTPIGREYNSTPTYGEDGFRLIQTTIQDHEATVRFEFIGKYDDQTSVSEMAQLLQIELRSATGYELQSINRLSLYNLSTLRRLPLPRETDMYMIYQLDCVFAYAAVLKTEQDYTLGLSVDGVYHDANQPPDYTIKTHFEITPTN
ncbi:hypothetical protein 16Q_049 [Pseudomonas phage 16Q]|nr:hypothetical protein 16Q_049 [Pseudomonas phage 16Q]